MRRFIVAFAVGAALIGVGLVGIGLGSHPERVASLRTLLIHSVTLVMGAAIIGSGMVGMAEGYEKVSRRLADLLGSRAIADSEVSLKTTAELDSSDRIFWTAYRNSSLAVALFMAAILAITVSTTGYSHLIYLACLSSGVALFGVTALLITYRGMRTIRQRQRQVGQAAELVDELPEAVEEEPRKVLPAEMRCAACCARPPEPTARTCWEKPCPPALPEKISSPRAKPCLAPDAPSSAAVWNDCNRRRWSRPARFPRSTY